MKILFVHQGVDLYGSDRVLINSIRAARQKYPLSSITLQLPSKGKLWEFVSNEFSDVLLREKDIAVLRLVELKKANFLVLWRILKNLLGRNDNSEYDIIYVNSIVIIDHLIRSVFSSQKYVIHVHEYPIGIARSFFKSLLRFSRGKKICISKAVRDNLSLNNADTTIVWNGVEDKYTKQSDFNKNGAFNFLIIGRINSWKGQRLLVEAIATLPESIRKNILLKILGDPFPGQKHYLDELKKVIAENNLSDAVLIEGFRDDPTEFYEWADYIVVPSIKPEPFGLVAIEGLRHGKVVIAANHGGLAEIIEDRCSGYRFRPNSIKNLAEVIELAISEAEQYSDFSARARNRFLEEFTIDKYIEKIGKVL